MALNKTPDFSARLQASTAKGLDPWQALCDAMGTRCSVVNPDGHRCDGGVTDHGRCAAHQKAGQ